MPPKKKEPLAKKAKMILEKKRKTRSRSSSEASSRSRSRSPPARSPTPPPPPPEADVPKKRDKKKSVILTNDQEAMLADWLRDNAMLYSKGLTEYKNRAKKVVMWREKAQEVNLESGEMLKVWYNSVRTKVGKLLKVQKSGDAARTLTDRDNYLLRDFGFLIDHVTRVKGKPACSVSRTIQNYLHFHFIIYVYLPSTEVSMFFSSTICHILVHKSYFNTGVLTSSLYS